MQNNISLFKNNLIQVIDSFLVSEKDKNAKFCEMFKKNGEVYDFDSNLISKFAGGNADGDIICGFLKNAGANEYDYEKSKISNFVSFLDEKINLKQEELKTKGDLALKLCLSIGAVICIIIWWVYGRFNTF